MTNIISVKINVNAYLQRSIDFQRVRDRGRARDAQRIVPQVQLGDAVVDLERLAECHRALRIDAVRGEEEGSHVRVLGERLGECGDALRADAV